MGIISGLDCDSDHMVVLGNEGGEPPYTVPESGQVGGSRTLTCFLSPPQQIGKGQVGELGIGEALASPSFLLARGAEQA